MKKFKFFGGPLNGKELVVPEKNVQQPWVGLHVIRFHNKETVVPSSGRYHKKCKIHHIVGYEDSEEIFYVHHTLLNLIDFLTT